VPAKAAFGVRELAPAFAMPSVPPKRSIRRRCVNRESGGEPPHSKMSARRQPQPRLQLPLNSSTLTLFNSCTFALFNSNRDYLLDTDRRFLCHLPVHTKRIKRIALQVLVAIFLAILLVSFLAHRLFHPR